MGRSVILFYGQPIWIFEVGDMAKNSMSPHRLLAASSLTPHRTVWFRINRAAGDYFLIFIVLFVFVMFALLVKYGPHMSGHYSRSGTFVNGHEHYDWNCDWHGPEAEKCRICEAEKKR